MFRKFITAVTISCFITTMCAFPSVAYAQDATEEATEEESPATPERVTTLRAGDPAPFAGTLFSVTAAARLLTDLEFTQEACELEVTRRLQLQGSEFQLQLDTQNARYASLEFRHNELMALRSQQIEFLTANYEPPKWYESGEFWFATGVVGGILIAIGTGYALGQINN